jgi:hypothetical protein
MSESELFAAITFIFVWAVSERASSNRSRINSLVERVKQLEKGSCNE